jgi:hypothetical protein
MQTEPEGTSLPRKEGMEGFYDKILTDYLNSYGKDYGSQVQMRQVAATPKAMEKKFNLNPNNLPDMNAEQASDYGKILQGFGNTQLTDAHYFPITQPMRESIKQKGLPLYQQVGIPTAGAGAASQMLEPQEEPEYSKGGSIAKMAALAKMKKMKEEMTPRAEAVKNLIARDQNRYLADVVPNSLTNAEIEAEIKRIAAKAPMVMKPSALTELRKIVQKEKGDYGSRRLERAADEIPNLERLYKEQALKEAFIGDNARALMTMNPADFEKYAVPLDPRFMDENSTRYTTSGERLAYPDYMKDYFNMGREQERQYAAKKKARVIIKKVTKPSPMSIAGLIVGAGVFYQIISPTAQRIAGYAVPVYARTLKPIVTVVVTDLKMLVQKIRGINPDWETYKRFDEMARGKR